MSEFTKIDQTRISSSFESQNREFVSGSLYSSSYTLEDDLNDLRSVVRENFGTSTFKEKTSRTLQENSDFIEFSSSESNYKEYFYVNKDLIRVEVYTDDSKSNLLYSSSFVYANKDLIQSDTFRARDGRILRKYFTYASNQLASVSSSFF